MLPTQWDPTALPTWTLLYIAPTILLLVPGGRDHALKNHPMTFPPARGGAEAARGNALPDAVAIAGRLRMTTTGMLLHDDIMRRAATTQVRIDIAERAVAEAQRQTAIDEGMAVGSEGDREAASAAKRDGLMEAGTPLVSTGVVAVATNAARDIAKRALTDAAGKGERGAASEDVIEAEIGGESEAPTADEMNIVVRGEAGVLNTDGRKAPIGCEMKIFMGKERKVLTGDETEVQDRDETAVMTEDEPEVQVLDETGIPSKGV